MLNYSRREVVWRLSYVGRDSRWPIITLALTFVNGSGSSRTGCALLCSFSYYYSRCARWLPWYFHHLFTMSHVPPSTNGTNNQPGTDRDGVGMGRDVRGAGSGRPASAGTSDRQSAPWPPSGSILARAQPPTKVTVFGSGSFGTALAALLARNGHEVSMLTRQPTVVESVAVSEKMARKFGKWRFNFLGVWPWPAAIANWLNMYARMDNAIDVGLDGRDSIRS